MFFFFDKCDDCHDGKVHAKEQCFHNIWRQYFNAFNNIKYIEDKEILESDLRSLQDGGVCVIMTHRLEDTKGIIKRCKMIEYNRRDIDVYLVCMTRTDFQPCANFRSYMKGEGFDTAKIKTCRFLCNPPKVFSYSQFDENKDGYNFLKCLNELATKSLKLIKEELKRNDFWRSIEHSLEQSLLSPEKEERLQHLYAALLLATTPPSHLSAEERVALFKLHQNLQKKIEISCFLQLDSSTIDVKSAHGAKNRLQKEISDLLKGKQITNYFCEAKVGPA